MQMTFIFSFLPFSFLNCMDQSSFLFPCLKLNLAKTRSVKVSLSLGWISAQICKNRDSIGDRFFILCIKQLTNNIQPKEKLHRGFGTGRTLTQRNRSQDVDLFPFNAVLWFLFFWFFELMQGTGLINSTICFPDRAKCSCMRQGSGLGAGSSIPSFVTDVLCDYGQVTFSSSIIMWESQDLRHPLSITLTPLPPFSRTNILGEFLSLLLLHLSQTLAVRSDRMKHLPSVLST